MSVLAPPTGIGPTIVIGGLFGAQAMIKVCDLGENTRARQALRQNGMQIVVFILIPLAALISGYAHPLQLWPLALALLAGTTGGSRMMTGVYEQPRAHRLKTRVGLALASAALAALIYRLTRTGLMHFGTVDIREHFSFDPNWGGLSDPLTLTLVGLQAGYFLAQAIMQLRHDRH